jgi:hypothetical protein
MCRQVNDMIYLYAKLHTPSINGSIAIVTKPKPKCVFKCPACYNFHCPNKFASKMLHVFARRLAIRHFRALMLVVLPAQTYVQLLYAAISFSWIERNKNIRLQDCFQQHNIYGKIQMQVETHRYHGGLSRFLLLTRTDILLVTSRHGPYRKHSSSVAVFECCLADRAEKRLLYEGVTH